LIFCCFVFFVMLFGLFVVVVGVFFTTYATLIIFRKVAAIESSEPARNPAARAPKSSPRDLREKFHPAAQVRAALVVTRSSSGKCRAVSS